MPDRALHFCAEPGCSALTVAPRCPAHARAREQARPNVDARRRYHTARWRALRATVLREAAYQCATCRQVAVDLVVDHIRKHEGDARRFWDRANLQALCPACHGRKTQAGA